MPVDDPFVLALEYAPVDYAACDVSREGRWCEIRDSQGRPAVLWTDGERGAGCLTGDEDWAPGTNELAASMRRVFRALARHAVPAADAYETAKHVDVFVTGHEQRGKLLAARVRADCLPLHGPGLYAAFDQDDEQLVGLVLSNSKGMYLRQAGTWVPWDPPESVEVLNVSVHAVVLVDELARVGERPSRSELEPYKGPPDAPAPTESERASSAPDGAHSGAERRLRKPTMAEIRKNRAERLMWSADQPIQMIYREE